jgi:hypothetical protein
MRPLREPMLRMSDLGAPRLFERVIMAGRTRRVRWSVARMFYNQHCSGKDVRSG